MFPNGFVKIGVKGFTHRFNHFHARLSQNINQPFQCKVNPFTQSLK